MLSNPNSLVSNQKGLLFPLWYERFLSLLILINYGMVLFDMSYIPFRDFWLQGRVQISVKIGPFEANFPQTPLRILPISVAQGYDWVKGIEPYRTTQDYLELVDHLTSKIDQKALESPDLETSAQASSRGESIDDILKELQTQSQEMIETNPFQSADKTGTLERIKNKMRMRVFGTTKSSATQAFKQFWTRAYLLKKGSTQELNFFNQQIRPLIETNYFRAIAENGQPVDNFPLLDFPFFLIFLTDFLVRTKLISQHQRGISWFDAMLWRWYDTFLLIPVFRWLRILPLVIHLDQSRVISLKQIKHQAIQGFVAIIAEEMIKILVIRLVDQAQDVIRQGKLRDLLNYQGSQSYVDINNQNEIVEITRIVSQVIIEKVLPKIEPEVENFVIYNIEQVLNQSVTYQKLQSVPGVKGIQTQLTEQFVSQTYQKVQEILAMLLQKDPTFEELLEKLVASLMKITNQEMKTQNYLTQIENLLIDLLEEIKINYLEQLSQTDINYIIEESRTLHQRIVAE